MGKHTLDAGQLPPPRERGPTGMHARATRDHVAGGNVAIPPLAAHAPPPAGVEGPTAKAAAEHVDAVGGATHALSVSDVAGPHAMAQPGSAKNVSAGSVHASP